MSGAEKPIPAIAIGRKVRVLRIFGDRISLRIGVDAALVCLLLMTLSLAIGVASLVNGDYPTTAGDIVDVVTGQGSERLRMLVLEWRLPRILMAFVLGAALGASGAIFQSMTRNPLGSPDIIGFGAGAHTGAILAMLLLAGSQLAIAIGALAGGLLTALVVYLLALGNRGVQGFRLIIVGIGVTAMLSSVNTWLLLKARLEVAMTAAIWGAGSLDGADPQRLGLALLATSFLLGCALLLERPMRQMEMGDDIATAAGVDVRSARLLLAVVGVGLIAVATAAAGPVGFVALAAPQLARRLSRGIAGISIAPAAAMGSLLLVTADFAAEHMFGSIKLPVGIVTLCLGGLYFAWLLLRERGRQQNG